MKPLLARVCGQVASAYGYSFACTKLSSTAICGWCRTKAASARLRWGVFDGIRRNYRWRGIFRRRTRRSLERRSKPRRVASRSRTGLPFRWAKSRRSPAHLGSREAARLGVGRQGQTRSRDRLPARQGHRWLLRRQWPYRAYRGDDLAVTGPGQLSRRLHRVHLALPTHELGVTASC